MKLSNLPPGVTDRMIEDQIAHADFRVENHGSLVLVFPITQDAKDWLDENVRGEQQWFGSGLAVEPRYIADLIAGMYEAGLEQE
jgi:hypothetical protein